MADRLVGGIKMTFKMVALLMSFFTDQFVIADIFTRIEERKKK